MKKPRLVILGTGTCQLEPNRMASSVLVQLPEAQFVFDMGRGISLRLVEVGLRQDDIEHVVLSHFHADHIGDLVPFLQAAAWSRTDPRSTTLHVYGPLGVKVQMMRLIGLCGPDELLKPTFDVQVHEVRGNEFTIGKLQLSTTDLPPAGNRGISFTCNGKRIGFTGDSSFHAQEIEFLKGLDLAVIDSGHLSDDELVDLATLSSCNEIYLSHLYRELNVPALQASAEKKGYKGRFVLAHDLMEIAL
jgi:ribonuclease BN (tRNA processing enzyme)